MTGYQYVLNIDNGMDFSTATTAEEVFRIARQQDRERWRAVAAAHPVADSADDDYRHATGVRRVHRNKGVAKRVPKEQRRVFTAAQWAEVKRLRDAELREMRLTYALALELAQEGM